ncbi:MAG: sulfite exporter TauE/SafE family protein [Lachnotalea sp.]
MDFFMIIAVICAYIVKGMCGFANTLVFSSMLAFRTSNINIAPVELVIGYPANIIIAWKEKKSLSTKIWLPLSCLVIAGSIPGIFLLKGGNITLLKIIFGFVIVFIGVEMFFREYQKKQMKSSPLVLGVIGIASGILCGLFGIGALLAAYIGRTTDNTNSFRGNLCIVFLVENTFRIVLYSLTGIINSNTIKTAVLLMPFMLLGLVIGNQLTKVFNEKMVKKFVIVLLILSGVSLIVKNMFA